jgi:hypothetical protein
MPGRPRRRPRRRCSGWPWTIRSRHAARLMGTSVGGARFRSWTGRAVSAGHGRVVPDARAAATILIVGPDGWPSAPGAITAATRAGFRVILAPDFADSGHYNLINAAILPVALLPETVTELQAAVKFDPGILLTVDIYRQDVRARGGLVARIVMGPEGLPHETESVDYPDRLTADQLPPFWSGHSTDGMAGRLLMAQRLLGSTGVPGDARIRLQRRFAAICDALKSPDADPARGAWRLDGLLNDLAKYDRAGLATDPPGSASGAADPSGGHEQ